MATVTYRVRNTKGKQYTADMRSQMEPWYKSIPGKAFCIAPDRILLVQALPLCERPACFGGYESPWSTALTAAHTIAVQKVGQAGESQGRRQSEAP